MNIYFIFILTNDRTPVGLNLNNINTLPPPPHYYGGGEEHAPLPVFSMPGMFLI